MNRCWNGFLFRQLYLVRNIRKHWFRLKAKTFNFTRSIQYHDRRRFMIALTSATGFSFKKHGISQERIEECIDVVSEFENCKKPEKGWELLYEEPDMLAFRRRINGPYELYEYKCVGTYRDVSPRTFLDAQNDLKYRREWDDNILSIEVVEEQDENELIRWVSKFPYPLYPREYVYVRRTWVSDDEKYAVIDSEAIQPDVFPSTSTSNVRVTSYTSRMSIRAHADWESHGVDYILTYSDNPEANIPRYVYNWMVNKGGPYFLRQVHKAAREIEENEIVVRSATEKALARKNKRIHEMELLQREKEEKLKREAEDVRDKEAKEESKAQKPENKIRNNKNSSASFIFQSETIKH